MFAGNPVPIAMTTTRAKRLFMFNCVNGNPTLHLVRDGKYVTAWNVFYHSGTLPEHKCAGSWDDKEMANVTKPGYLLRVLGDVSISRVVGEGNVDIVRIVYPAVANGRRVARIVVVKLEEAGGSYNVSKVHEWSIESENPTGHVLYPTFIETDRVDLPKTSTVNTAVLYWYETVNTTPRSIPGLVPPPMLSRNSSGATPAAQVNTTPRNVAGGPLPLVGDAGLVTRYSVFREGGETNIAPVGQPPGGKASNPRPLSVTDGSERSWQPGVSQFVGDYMRGAFAYDGKLRFIAQWPEKQGTYLGIRFNVITVEP
jgi:hypothetical protein